METIVLFFRWVYHSLNNNLIIMHKPTCLNNPMSDSLPRVKWESVGVNPAGPNKAAALRVK